MNNQPPAPSKEEQEAYDKAMSAEHTMAFQKKELIVIFNILTKIDMKYGDSLIIGPIIRKIEPIVAVDTNITKRAEEAEAIALGKKKEVN